MQLIIALAVTILTVVTAGGLYQLGVHDRDDTAPDLEEFP